MTPHEPSRSLYARAKRKVVGQWRAKPARLSFPKGVLSISFDDAPQSAMRTGAQIAESHGARATFFLSGSYMGGHTHFGPMHTQDDLARAIAVGHEIGCHSYSHRDAGVTPIDVMAADVTRNERVLKTLGAPAPRSFAYPYGETSARFKAEVAKRFATGRGITGGLNVGPVDLAQLRAQRLYGAETYDVAADLMARAKHACGWLILFTHDVQDKPTAYGCTPATLDAALLLARQLNLAILPIRDALASATVHPC